MPSNDQTSSESRRMSVRGITIHTIDDTDPAIRYVGQWEMLHLENAFHKFVLSLDILLLLISVCHIYRTVHSTMAAGASLEYNFTGMKS